MAEGSIQTGGGSWSHFLQHKCYFWHTPGRTPKLGAGVTLVPRATVQQGSRGHPAVWLSWAVRVLWWWTHLDALWSWRSLWTKASPCSFPTKSVSTEPWEFVFIPFQMHHFFPTALEAGVQTLQLSSFHLTGRYCGHSLGVSGVSWPLEGRILGHLRGALRWVHCGLTRLSCMLGDEFHVYTSTVSCWLGKESSLSCPLLTQSQSGKGVTWSSSAQATGHWWWHGLQPSSVFPGYRFHTGKSVSSCTSSWSPAESWHQ